MIVADERVARFVSDRLDFALCPPYTTLGIDRDGEIAAGCIFHCFEGCAVHVTVAGTGWTKGFFRAVGEYVFDQLGCERITITTEHDNVAAMAIRLGGEIEGCLRNQFGPGRDATVIGVLRNDYRYGSKGGLLQRG